MTNLLIAGALAGGAYLTFNGLSKRKSSQGLGSLRLSRIGTLSPGTSAAIQGPASSPFPIGGAGAVRPRVFYDEVATLRQTAATPSGRAAHAEERHTQYGGFFVEDESGKAFVFPPGSDLTITSPEAKETGAEGALDSTERRRTKIIEPGRTVCVAGTAHTLPEFLDFLKRGPIGPAMPTPLIQSLVAMAQQGTSLPCFYSDGRPFFVGDIPYDELRKELASSGDTELSAGLVLLVAGAAILAGRYLGVL